MPRLVTSERMGRPSTGLTTRLEDLVLAEMADGTVHGSITIRSWSTTNA